MSRPSSNRWNRRRLLTGAATVAAGAALAPVRAAEQAACSAGEVKTYASADFYDADGKFLEDKARQAYYDMFQRFHYPISETLKREMWILEFGLGDFARVGMAGIFWLNRQDYNYFGHEIFLLPGQMIPEHRHLKTALGAPKMESWQPRRGMIYTFGEGEATPELLEHIPPSQRDQVHSRRCTPLGIDEIGHLNRLTAWHFMVAGPEGTLVTEYGTFHDMDGLEFSNPTATL
jgi:D-lyxose ketol-isomerase